MNKLNLKDLANNKQKIKIDKNSLIKNYGPTRNFEIIRKMIVYTRLFETYKIKTDYILDLGCGFGTLTKILALIFKKVDAFDYFEEAINHSKNVNSNIKNIDYICSDIFNYEFESLKYDVVFASEFHPLTRNLYQDNNQKDISHKNIIDKIYKSLKKDGMLIISHAPVKKQNINIDNVKGDKFEVILYEYDERIIYLFDSILRIFKNDKIYFVILKILSNFKKLLFKLKIIKNLKLIYILRKKT